MKIVNDLARINPESGSMENFFPLSSSVEKRLLKRIDLYFLTILL